MSHSSKQPFPPALLSFLLFWVSSLYFECPHTCPAFPSQPWGVFLPQREQKLNCPIILLVAALSMKFEIASVIWFFPLGIQQLKINVERAPKEALLGGMRDDSTSYWCTLTMQLYKWMKNRGYSTKVSLPYLSAFIFTKVGGPECFCNSDYLQIPSSWQRNRILQTEVQQMLI